MNRSNKETWRDLHAHQENQALIGLAPGPSFFGNAPLERRRCPISQVESNNRRKQRRFSRASRSQGCHELASTGVGIHGRSGRPQPPRNEAVGKEDDALLPVPKYLGTCLGHDRLQAFVTSGAATWAGFLTHSRSLRQAEPIESVGHHQVEFMPGPFCELVLLRYL